VDKYENVYVADFNNDLIRKVSSEGKVTTVAGSGDFGCEDGMAFLSTFSHPIDVASMHTQSIFC